MTGGSGHIAHLNWAYLSAPWGDPAVAGFTDNVDRVNAAAARSTGFVARPELDSDELHRLIYAPRGAFNPIREAATVSVWETAEDLENFVYRTVHGQFEQRRGAWFVPLGRPTYVIWPVTTGHIPDLAEADRKLALLESAGASAESYDFAWAKAASEAVQ